MVCASPPSNFERRSLRQHDARLGFADDTRVTAVEDTERKRADFSSLSAGDGQAVPDPLDAPAAKWRSAVRSVEQRDSGVTWSLLHALQSGSLPVLDSNVDKPLSNAQEW